MAEDRELEDEQGKVLPLREMMSTISADPNDPMYSTLVPPDAPAAGSGAGPGPVAQLPAGDRLPVEGPEGAAGSEPRSETITQTDSASAKS